MEEMSEVLILLPPNMVVDFEKIESALSFSESMSELAVYAGLSEDVVWDSEIAFNFIEVKNPFVLIGHDIAVWSDLSSEFVLNANNLEYYSIHQSEHGLVSLFSLNDSGERLNIEVNTEAKRKKALSSIDKWRNSLSTAARIAFPNFEKISL